jgi:hypothetical protein
MSPTKRPSAVDSLRRATAPAPATMAAANGKPVKAKPVRITLDLDPADYQELNHWLGSVAARVNAAPGKRVTLASALRAMIKATTRDENMTIDVLTVLREDSE